MGQIVQYGSMQNKKPNEKMLKWCDLQKPGEDKKDVLAKIVPIKETIDFSKKVTVHHNKQ